MQVFETLQADDPQQVGLYRIVARLGAGGMGMSTWAARKPAGRPEQRPTAAALLDELAEHRTDGTALTTLFTDTSWLPATVAQAVRTRIATALPATQTIPTPQTAQHGLPDQPTPQPANTSLPANGRLGSDSATHQTSTVSVRESTAPNADDTRKEEAAVGKGAAAAVPHRREEISRRRPLLMRSSLGLSTAGFAGWRIYENSASANDLDAPGGLRWSFNAHGAVRSRPAVVDGKITQHRPLLR